MVEKLYEYQGFLGRLHGLRDSYREKWISWKEEHPGGLIQAIRSYFYNLLSSKSDIPNSEIEDYSHIYR